MLKNTLRPSDLEAYLDEALLPEEMARIENLLRTSPEHVQGLAAIHARRDLGVHSLGEIWRRHRLSCATRQQLGSYLLEAVEPNVAEYIRFHLEVVGCRYCLANLADLAQQQSESRVDVEPRRRRYFESSAGYLHAEKR